MSDSDIAIIGMAGRFPKAASVQQFWKNLRDGVEGISFFSEEELLAAGVPQTDLARPDYIRARGILDGYDQFDHEFFGFSPREAELLNPQHRCFLECAWSALEDSGYAPERYSGAIGVFAGSSTNSYFLHALRRWGDTLDPFQIAILNDKDFVPTHVSYRLNLRGPSYNVQTACSTSLVAVHVACQNLLTYQCDVALAGGVSIMLPQLTGYLFTPGGIQSPDGHCRAFDAKAQGTVGGAGVGIIVLKRFADALADGDTIRAVIKGSAVNNDGSGKVGFTAPSVEGQAAVVAEALAVAGVSPEAISYVETHGTGTSLGDPIEIAALSKAYRAHTERRQFCGIGSVKTNIGHLDAAAGVAGLIKTVLALENRFLPASLHFERPNPQFELSESPFFVVGTARAWDTFDTPRRAGVSSFGIGGTNAHAVLEEAPEVPAAAESQEVHALLLSGRTEEVVARRAGDLANHLETGDANLSNVVWTLQQGRKHFVCRRAVICSNKSEAVELLRTGGLLGKVSGGSHQVAFLFPGLGPQYPNMAAQLFRTQPFFRKLIEAGREVLQPMLQEDLRAIMWPARGGETRAASLLAQPIFGMPLLFLQEYALARLWIHFGVEPDALLGHSLGEYAAACIAGVFSWEDGLRLVAERGALFSSVPAGVMVRVALSSDEVRPLLPVTLSIAAVNGPENTVIAGDDADVREWLAEVASRRPGLEFQELAVHAPGHCRLVEPLLEHFRAALRKTPLRAPRLRYLSNLTGEWITASEATDPEYWLQHMRQPVQFERNARRLFDDLADPLLAIEAAPGRTLTSLLKLQSSASRPVTLLPSLPHATENTADAPVFLSTAARLWLNGVDIKWSSWYDGEARRRVPLPTYPFERHTFDLATGRLDAQKLRNTSRLDPQDWFSIPTWTRSSLRNRNLELPTGEEWLILSDRDGLAEALGTVLEEHGQQVLRVAAEDLRSTVSSALRRCRGKLRHVLDCRAFASAGDMRSATEYYENLLPIAQACGSSVASPIRLTVIANGLFDVTGSEWLCPNKAAVLGLCRVLPQEHPHVTCRVIDVVREDGSPCDLAELLVSELLAADPVVALRTTYRWAPRYVPLKPPTARDLPLRHGGVYWITGGLGMVGSILARRLARDYHAHLILTTSGSPDRKKHLILELEALGATVLALQADVSDPAQLAQALAEGERRFGTIHGVIHAAGRLRPCTIAEENSEVAAWHIVPKADGLDHLAAVLQNRALDFCIVMSSLATVLGGLGLASYSASNAVADARVALLRRHSNIQWLSVNWDGWRSDDAAERLRSMAAQTMSPDEGWTAFETALAHAEAHVQLVHSIGDLQGRLAQWVEGATRHSPQTETSSGGSRNHIQTPYQQPDNEIERTIAGLWEQLLGVAPIGRRDNFFEAGGHSLLATRLIAILRETFQVDIPLRPMFLQPTVEAWAALVVEATLASTPRDVLSRALDEAAAHG